MRVDKKLQITDLYVDRTYLRILLNPYGESYGLRELVNFLFKTRLAAIETTNRDQHGNALVFSSPHNPNETVIRLSIKPLGHPSCKVYDYPNRYPAQALPWLRKLGLGEDSCVGIEGFATPQSKVGIYVQEQLLGKQFNGMNWQKRIDVTLSDSSNGTPVLAALMVDHYSEGGGGKAGLHHGFPCSTGDSQVKTFRTAFDAKDNPNIRPPTVVDLPPYVVDASYANADENRLSAMQWISEPGEKWASNLINAEGTAWVEWSPPKYQRVYTFNIFSDGKIYTSPILIPQGGSQNVTGLAKTAQGYALIASVGRGAGIPRYIVEFDAKGNKVSISMLSDDQYKKLAIPEMPF